MCAQGRSLAGRLTLPLKSDVALSNDLGYTYGSYELKGTGDAVAASSASEKGYYVRVWKRDRAGRWKIALDTTHPLLSAEK